MPHGPALPPTDNSQAVTLMNLPGNYGATLAQGLGTSYSSSQLATMPHWPPIHLTDNSQVVTLMKMPGNYGASLAQGSCSLASWSEAKGLEEVQVHMLHAFQSVPYMDIERFCTTSKNLPFLQRNVIHWRFMYYVHYVHTSKLVLCMGIVLNPGFLAPKLQDKIWNRKPGLEAGILVHFWSTKNEIYCSK